MRKFVLVLLFALSGCAYQQVQEVLSWSKVGKEQARNGEIKWSDYYKGLYDRVSVLPPGYQGKAFYLQAANLLIDASSAMEDGRISLDVFQSFQREMTATEAQYVERLQIQNAAAWAQAAATYNSYLQTQALQAQAWRTAQPIHCVSNRTGAFVNTTCY